jgi:NAD+ diphosphatase
MKIFEYCPACGSKEISFDDIKLFKCKVCSFSFFQNVAAAAAAILDYDGKILFVKRGQEPEKGKLDLPGGFLDPKESAEEGLRREIREELHIDLQQLKYIGSAPNVYTYQSVTYHTCDLFFYSQIDALPAILDKTEIEELLLIHPSQIPYGKIAFESTKSGLKLFNLQKSY